VRRLATSEPPPGSVTARAEILWPARIGGRDAVLEGVAAEVEDRRGADAVAEQAGDEAACVGAGELLDDDEGGAVIAGGAAVLLGEAEAEQAELAGAGVERAR
jgi:hypothetical protein